MSAPLLEVVDLRIDLAGAGLRYAAVEGVSFSIPRGETVGLVGESGCGKSITALAVMGLLRPPLGIGGGRICFEGREIQALPPSELERLRGRRIAMIFQEPMTALNPLSRVGRQIAEMFVLHEGASWREAQDKAVEALRRVRVPRPERRAKDYPHQLSGGMRQRVMIAIALACAPDLLVADEPTTALDVTVQSEIIDLMQELCAEKGTAILMISHDLGLVASMCRRVGVMYAGRLVEERAAQDVFRAPSHPYTQGLVASLPRLGARAAHGAPAAGDQGRGAVDRGLSAGLPFPSPVRVASDVCRRCRAGASRRRRGRHRALPPPCLTPAETDRKRRCSRSSSRRAFSRRVGFRRRRALQAVDGVEPEGHARRMPGPRGRIGMREIDPCPRHHGPRRADRGSDPLDGHEIGTDATTDRMALARAVQMVFQDPYASLNPRQTVRRTLADPLRLHGIDQCGRGR